MALEIHNLQAHLEVDFSLLGRAVQQSTGEEDPDISVSIVDDAAIRSLHRAHLGKDHPTDVLAFDYGQGEVQGRLSGEIVLSAETALRVAGEKGEDPLAELVLYLVHGILHLKGFDDKDPSMAERMWREQQFIMKSIGFNGNFLP